MGAIQGQNVLLYEDSEILYKPIKDLLESQGAQVKRALPEDTFLDDPEYSVGIFRCDSKTPELAQKLVNLKKRRPDFRIIITLEPSEKNKLPDELLNKTDFILEKPFTPEKLRIALERAVYLPLQGKEILIVEEVNISRKAFEQICVALGAKAHSFSSIPLESEIMSGLTLAITDLPLREQSSVTFLLKLREKNPNVQIFLVSNVSGAVNMAEVAILNEVSFIMTKPVNDDLLRKKIIEVIEQPYSDRRRSARKQGISNCWLSSWNQELNRPELFESPYLVDISQQGLSFQSYNEYGKDEPMIIWIADESTAGGNIIELRGNIRWVSNAGSAAGNRQAKKYGLQFDAVNSPGMDRFIRMIAGFIG